MPIYPSGVWRQTTIWTPGQCRVANSRACCWTVEGSQRATETKSRRDKGGTCKVHTATAAWGIEATTFWLQGDGVRAMLLWNTLKQQFGRTFCVQCFCLDQKNTQSSKGDKSRPSQGKLALKNLLINRNDHEPGWYFCHLKAFFLSCLWIQVVETAGPEVEKYYKMKKSTSGCFE